MELERVQDAAGRREGGAMREVTIELEYEYDGEVEVHQVRYAEKAEEAR